ncbi:MAG: 5-histidylcysteine sulfoxide synthase [Gammaproteobacteria bacterium]|nr:5-histidylcysteine sulfoxide synthase [Gammaproteobacteria bacterium]
MSSSSFLRTPSLIGSDVAAKRKEISAYFNATFERYESLFETLVSDHAYYQKPISLRHPLIFYYGHTATFFINKLILSGLIKQRINPKFESMFAIGVDEMSWDDLDDSHYDWPDVSEVKAYRQELKKVINELIGSTPLTLPIDWDNPWWTIMMGIEHEQIHIETSSVLIRQQALDLIKPHSAWQPWAETKHAPTNELLTIPAAKVKLGKLNDDVYGWDNEYGTHHSEVGQFQASKYLVSNQEFLTFVEDGGYKEQSYWHEDGLQWLNFSHAQHPSFWIKGKHGWQCRLMTEVVAMPWDWPAEVNYHEAKAFCNWKAQKTGRAIRLPTEDEWHRIVDYSGIEELKSGQQAQANIHNDHSASPCPVNKFLHGKHYDVVGNVWQWTETAIYPFDGFKVHPYYDDFTMPTYDGRHHLFKGGSWISSGNESRHDARYAFRQHFFQHAGFRYVEAEAVQEQIMSNYENDKMLSEYAEFHYGDSYYDVANFPQTIANIAIKALGSKPAVKALDIGCAVGRASFELAKRFDHVTGIDFSARLINLGVQLVEQGVIRYSIADEGELMLYRERHLSDLGLANVSDKVEFLQGDACNLKPHFKDYDLVIAANLIDRLYDPALFLRTIHERVNPGGVLLIASPYTWLEEHTKKENWLGGIKKDGENVSTLDGLKSILGEYFDLMTEPQQVPFVIRETSRKFQHTLSDVTLWVKK